MLDFQCSPDVSLQDLSSGWISEPQRRSTVGGGIIVPARNAAIFKGLRPPAADPQQNEGMMLRGYENHEAIALVTCAS